MDIDRSLVISTVPLRKVVTRGGVRVNGKFASRKMGRCLPWESQIERDFLILAEIDPTISAIYAQPVRILYMTDGCKASYVPDFAIVGAFGTEIHEVKPDAEAAKLEMQAKFGAAATVCADSSIVYCVALESAIREAPVLDNAQMLARYLHLRVDTLLKAAVRDVVDGRPGIAVGSLLGSNVAGGLSEAVVHGLLAQGVLRADLRQPLGPRSSLWTPEAFPGCARILPRATVRTRRDGNA